MSEIFLRVLDLIARQEVLISDHGYEELAADGILVTEVIEGQAWVSRSKSTRRIIEARAFWSYSMIAMASRFMSYGAFRLVQPLRPWS